MRLGLEVISAGETTENAFPSRNRYVHYFCNIKALWDIKSDLSHKMKRAGLYLPAGKNSFYRAVLSKGIFIYHYPKGAPGIGVFLFNKNTFRNAIEEHLYIAKCLLSN